MERADFAILQPGAVFHGRYRIVRLIKAGGMGAVYEVVDETTSERRALKVMIPSLVEDADMRARFAREARITRDIESEHVVRVIEAGVDHASATPFLVMELLDGEDLLSRSRERGPLPAGEVIAYLRQAALALEETHAAGIVHRDLKPENLFVASGVDGSPIVKILDFGIAKVVAQSTSKSTKAIGTKPYMSPEQIRGDGQLDHRADLYALGHVAYALLVGEPYWKEESAQGDYPLIHKITEGAKEPPTARARRRRGVALPRPFDAWFFRAAALRAEDRFGAANHAVAALAEALSAPADQWLESSAEVESTVPLPRGSGGVARGKMAAPAAVESQALARPGSVSGVAGEPSEAAKPRRRPVAAIALVAALAVAGTAAGLAARARGSADTAEGTTGEPGGAVSSSAAATNRAPPSTAPTPAIPARTERAPIEPVPTKTPLDDEAAKPVPKSSAKAPRSDHSRPRAPAASAKPAPSAAPSAPPKERGGIVREFDK